MPRNTTLDRARSDKQRKLLTLVTVASTAVITHYTPLLYKTPKHTSLATGQSWVDELLNGHGVRMKNNLGMQKHVFVRLLTVLNDRTNLCDSRHVSAEEQLAIFLRLARTGLGQREARERFQRSPETVSWYENCFCVM